MKTLLALGHGYTSQALAARLVPKGWRVLGTTRHPVTAKTPGWAGVTPVPLPGDLEPALRQATHVLVTAAPDQNGDPFLRGHGGMIAAARPEWVGYLSTTGVYGDRAGGWVDETSPLDPTTPRGRIRVAAEAAWRATGLPLHIFRLAGIYGPGRGPLKKARKGVPIIVKPGQIFSRIHVDDIAQVLEASILRPDPGAVYNVCDDEPAPPEDVLAYAARALGLPPPERVDFDGAALSEMARSFYSESKRVSNARLHRDLGIKLLYPTYREGIAALAAPQQPI